jgi:hypothetical protein
MPKAPVCGWTLERAARKVGALRIAGLDEVGRGCLLLVPSIRIRKAPREFAISYQYMSD